MPGQESVESLRSQCATLERFEAVLEEEQACLVRDDLEALTRLTPVKFSLAEQLAAFGTQAPAQPGASDDERTQLRARLRARVAASRQLNESNGKLIAMRLQHVQGALEALRGTPRAHTYGPDGLPGAGTARGRVLGSA